MHRDLAALENETFDLLILGGGIFGACAAWDAVLRGLRVALIERFDFGGQTSANSFKMVHGGVRYIQHGDLVRVRESARERRALLEIAPHLVQPLPIAIPTYGHGKRGRPLLAAGLFAYDLVTLDRNRGISDPTRRIPRARFLSRAGILAAFPFLADTNPSGAAVFTDAQMYNPTRLVLAFLRSAAERGATVANYVEAAALLLDGRRVGGVEALDRVSGGRFPIRARMVLNATGPWAEPWLQRCLGRPLARPTAYSRDACFVVRRRFESDLGLAVAGRTRDRDALLARGARHLFVVPWRGYTLIGVWHRLWRDPERVTVGDDELARFVDEINEACPALALTPSDVLTWNAGLLPFGDDRAGGEDLSYGKRSRLIDHAREHGLDGLISLIGIRYTMGRGDAAKAVDLAARKLAHSAPRPRTDRLPLSGGQIPDFEALVAEAAAADRFGLPAPVRRALLHNYGSAYREVLAHARHDPVCARPLPGSTVLAAEVNHAIREEMALTLADVVYRRTDLASAGPPDEAALHTAGELMARSCGWGAGRLQREIEAVREHRAPHEVVVA